MLKVKHNGQFYLVVLDGKRITHTSKEGMAEILFLEGFDEGDVEYPDDEIVLGEGNISVA